ncbi:hypothetical protein [Acidipila rosea]|uniref:Uncharacterized protein n=1 Tax=Acidipila rosea TaxID=768535 RepID=A0A4R1LCG9_9BACT|nr:hypothetical protein [Acidipila rosea]TCK75307.1 hypothetical protein C7378_0290 [Acidipila rosea]
MSFILTTALERSANRSLPEPLSGAVTTALEHLRKGCFQRSLCLVVSATSVASGLEVGYEHYKGSYSNPVMYTPVALSAALAGAGLLGFFSGVAARTLLRWISVITLADGIIGFFFHIRGVARKPGGWKLPVTNIVMGPPIFAPLLFGTSAYLGLMASYLRREEDLHSVAGRVHNAISEFAPGKADWRTNLRYGRFQKHLSSVTVLWAFFSGFEALYSHYKANFRYKAQWSPVLLTPLVMAAGIGAVKSRRIANTALPAASALALADGAIGFYYHVRGITRRPGGVKKPLYNTLYGPPVFAPLLFAACGFLGLMASLLRREKK